MTIGEGFLRVVKGGGRVLPQHLDAELEAPAALDVHNFHVSCLICTYDHSINIYVLRRSGWTPHLPHSGNY